MKCEAELQKLIAFCKQAETFQNDNSAAGFDMPGRVTVNAANVALQ